MQRLARVLVALAALAGCAGSGGSGGSAEPIRREAVDVVAVEAKVAAIDRAQRRVTLVDASGGEAAFQADEAVRNFDRIQVGDDVVGKLVEALVLEVRPPTPEEAAAGLAVLEVAARAEPGQRPAGLYVRRITAVLTIDALDREARTATLRGPAGNSRVVPVLNPANFDRVRVGDEVVATYTESLSLEVLAPGATPAGGAATP
jgi:hypothetical protein